MAHTSPKKPQNPKFTPASFQHTRKYDTYRKSNWHNVKFQCRVIWKISQKAKKYCHCSTQYQKLHLLLLQTHTKVPGSQTPARHITRTSQKSNVNTCTKGDKWKQFLKVSYIKNKVPRLMDSENNKNIMKKQLRRSGSQYSSSSVHKNPHYRTATY